MRIQHLIDGRAVDSKATFESINPDTDEVEMLTANAQSLLTADGIRFIYEGIVTNFMSFTAVGVIIVAMLAVMHHVSTLDEAVDRGAHAKDGILEPRQFELRVIGYEVLHHDPGIMQDHVAEPHAVRE